MIEHMYSHILCKVIILTVLQGLIYIIWILVIYVAFQYEEHLSDKVS